MLGCNADANLAMLMPCWCSYALNSAGGVRAMHVYVMLVMRIAEPAALSENKDKDHRAGSSRREQKIKIAEPVALSEKDV